MSDRVRVMRIIIYDGPREWVEKTIERSITGTKIIDPQMTITKSISVFDLNVFPEIIEKHEEGIRNENIQSRNDSN